MIILMVEIGTLFIFISYNCGHSHPQRSGFICCEVVIFACQGLDFCGWYFLSCVEFNREIKSFIMFQFAGFVLSAVFLCLQVYFDPDVFESNGE